MRAGGLLVLLAIAVGLAGCAGMPIGAGPDVVAPPPPQDLDNIMLGRGPGFPAPVPVVAPAPPPVVGPVPVPVGAPIPAPIPAALLPGPAPGGDEPYTLDSGDRLRIVVFGQDG